MVEYVLGFAFTVDSRVILVKKAKPEWQAGRMNGIGGKIEGSELAVEAMVREFREETNLVTTIHSWRFFAEIQNRNSSKIHLFSAHLNDTKGMHGCEEEPVDLYSVRDLPKNCINNLHWLIPLAWDYTAPTIFIKYENKN